MATMVESRMSISWARLRTTSASQRFAPLCLGRAASPPGALRGADRAFVVDGLSVFMGDLSVVRRDDVDVRRARTFADPTSDAASADQQHELSAHLTRFADAMCLRDFGQRERLSYGE